MEFLNNTVESQLVQRPLERGITPFNFPKTKSALWDPTPLDDSISIHLTYYRNPKLLVTEKILRFVHRHAKQSGRKVFSCFLLGSFVVDDDEEGVTLIVDRLDPGREAGHSDKVPTAPLPEDFIIPCIIDTQGLVSRDTKVYSSEDFKTTFKMLYHYCCSKETIDSSRLIVLRGRINCTENLDNLSLELQWAAVTVAITFDATPINAVPIIPTALARNLTSPLNIAQVQGTYKFGYLTMDQTRKLLLILESDPKVFTLPLVGIWLSGATHVRSPQVWACCLRYLFSSSIQERVFSTEQKRFLLVLYSVTHRQPEFYECHPCGEHQKLDFQLLTSTEVLNICTSIEPSGKQLTEFELSDENKNPNSDFFQEVVSNIMGIPMSVGDNDSGVEEDDLSPRPTPSPHPVVQKFPRVYPSVPELSLVFDGSFIESKYTPTRLQQNKLQQTMKTREASGPFNGNKQPSENGQQGVTSKMITPPLKHNLILSHGSVASVKSCKEKITKSQSKSSHFASKSSGSSSSSCSTPPSGPSPDASVDQPKLVMSTDAADTIKNVILNKGGISPGLWQSMSDTQLPQRPPSPNKSNRHSLQCIPPLPSHSPEMQHLGFSPYFHMPYPTSYCNCCQRHGPCCGPSLNSNWQGNTPAYGAKGVHSLSCHECSSTPCPQTLTCLPNSHCSIVCVNNNSINQSLPGQVGSTSPSNSSLMKSPGGSYIPPLNQCKIGTVPSACLHLPIGSLEHDQEGNGTMGLPVNAYKILVEQDRQLKLLQAQIQRLLGTQSGVTTPVTHCSSKNIGISDCSPQPERQMEFVAIETQTSPGIHMKKSVSIAVSTVAASFLGASLFLVPSEEHEAHQTVQNLELNDSELSNEEMGVSVKTDNTSHTSVVSSMNEVDIHNFVENSQNTTDSSDQAISVQSCTPEGTKSSWDLHVDFQSPVLGESASTCLKNSPTEVPHVNNSKTEKYDLITESHNSSPLQDERRFYQNLMVNQLLESSSEKQNEAENKDAESEVSVQNTETLNKQSEPQTFQKEDNDVLSATVKQLKKMGVKFDLDCTSMTKSKVENASTLARINPEAVIPRLNYTSFVNVGAVDLGAAGVDLSMEANAIALKYLNDAQLSQISLRRSGNCESPSLNNLLEMNRDGSMVGLSLISPNNMSFATRKYMRRYGLVEETYSSEEEDVLSDSAIRSIKSQSEIPSAKKTSSEKVVEAQLKNCCTPESFPKADGNILRNITNEISPTKPQNVDTQDCHCQQIRNNPKPKTNKFAEEIGYTKNPEKENGIERISDFSKKVRPTVLETHKSTKSSDAVGNILDVNRLRQLPKLF
ncbi:SCL-interrupting locus protein homolog isoform X2 [Chiloscyllium plagiosum]|uniref:SCL-interrupting locus protein homolog isoform X2 n=1 Tax=Chiloscyllium plagiosum TaxID=36176 RepID=UPI001CB7B618|nr:SCL-interrupting locus protein homolog isoform X2 [Chiloscyllium plagiosum]